MVCQLANFNCHSSLVNSFLVKNYSLMHINAQRPTVKVYWRLAPDTWQKPGRLKISSELFLFANISWPKMFDLRLRASESEALSASNWNRAVEGPVEIDSVWPFGIQLHKIQWIMQYGLTPKLRVRILNFIDERLASHQTPWLTINGRQWGSSSQACSNLGQIKLRCEWCDLIVSFGRILRNALLKRTTVQTKSQSVEQCY